MKFSKLKVILPVVVFAVLAIGLIVGVDMGTLSGFGPDVISALCPLGAFTTMIATRTLLPRPIISIVIMAVLVLLAGRAYCAYICPVSIIENLRSFFRSPKKRREMEKVKHDELIDIAKYEISCGHECSSCASKCAQKRPKFDGRHGVLVGALLSSAVFGFPVFCLVCPVGLTFATVLLVWRLFAFGDTTIAVILVVAMLVIELFVIRKWCIRFCPLAALMNLVSRFSPTTKPVIDNQTCLETTKGVPCSKCAMACEHGINLRHITYGEHDLADCTRCRACVEACPTKAISMPLVYRQSETVWLGNLRSGKSSEEKVASATEAVSSETLPERVES